MERPRPAPQNAWRMWLLATLLAAFVLAWIAAPALLIQPFKPQTPFAINPNASSALSVSFKPTQTGAASGERRHGCGWGKRCRPTFRECSI